jgi:4-hydroxy-tetrahydrodipicolinate reductase
MIKIGIIGYKGRLGAAIHRVALTDPRFEIGALIGRGDPIPPCDLYINVSTPESLFLELSPQVIGVTGIDRSSIERAAETQPIFYAPNFSLGMALLTRLAAIATHFCPSDTSRQITESHRAGKKDAPSGSALLLSETIGGAPIESIRSGEILGEHTLQLSLKDEELILSHRVQSRDTFAKGALEAASFLHQKPPGLYTMDHLFKITDSAIIVP